MEEEINFIVNAETQLATENLKTLTKEVEDLNKNQKELNEQLQKGAITQEEYNKASKKNVDQAKKSQTSIDNYNKTIEKNTKSNKDAAKSLDDYSGSLSQINPQLGGAIEGFKGLVSTAKAFIATPIGLILAAVALALGAVYKYLEKFEPVLDVIEDAVTAVSNVFNAFIDNLDKVGSIIGNVFAGNFSKAADAASELGSAMKNAAIEGQAILDLTREIDDLTIEFELSSSRVELQIKRLVTAAKNRTLTANQQQDLLNKAINLENQQLEKNLEIKNKQFEADFRALVLDKKSQVDKNKAFQEAVAQNKTLQQQFEILATSGIFGAEDEKLLKALSSYKAIAQAEGESLAFVEKVENQKDAIRERNAAANKARAEKEKAQAEKRAADLQKLIDKENELAQKGIQKGIERINKQKQLESELEAVRKEIAAKNIEQVEVTNFEELKLFVQKEKEKTQLLIDAETIRREAELKNVALTETEKQIIKAESNQKIVELRNQLDDAIKKADEDLMVHNAEIAQEELKMREEITAKQVELANQGLALLSMNASNRQQILDNELKAGKISQEKYDKESKKLFDRNKKLEIANTIISTLVSAQKAYQSQIIPMDPTSVARAAIAAGITLAQGYARVKAIKATNYESASESGETQSSGQASGRGSGPSQGAGIGAPYVNRGFEGSMVSSATTTPIDRQYSMAQAFKNMPPVVASWKEATELSNRVKFKEAVSTI